ncbi:hypothetical protein EDD18DRAFT_1106886 [Armillaria luteobubalina]|uniref:Uncharacterized protein n=1 Tax=Armillaria luteobubalina TaxID=153913 RepID=A0AA39US62_9AGAR|nr:hypothetical protein EDD18DRAFT_1106886 [Armillaria luteobubalina]
MGYIEQRMNTEHGFRCSIEADRPTEWRSGGCAASFLAFSHHIAAHHHSLRDGTAIEMAYKGVFFMRERLPHATNEDEDDDAYRTTTTTKGMGRGLEKWRTSVETPLWPDARPSSRHPPKTTYSASYSTADDATTGASIADTTTDLTHPTTPVRSNYRARRCRPPPRPSSPSPASPRTSRAPTFGHLPLFEWGNIAVRLVFPIDPTVTCRPPTTPPPALDDIPPALQGSPLPRNLTTPVFDNGECNGNVRLPIVRP